MSLSVRAIEDYKQILKEKGLPIPDDVEIQAEQALRFFASIYKPITSKKDVTRENID